MAIDMKKFSINRVILCTAIIYLIPLISLAQQRIDPTLEVKRDFDARLLEITKGKLFSSFADSLGRFDLNFRYTIFDKPIKDLYEFSPLPSAGIEREIKDKKPFFYLTAGSNLPLSPYAGFYIHPRLPSYASLLLWGNHTSYHGKLPGVERTDINDIQRSALRVPAPSNSNDLGVKFTYRWRSGEAGVSAVYGNNMNSYYGTFPYAPALVSMGSIADADTKRSFMADSLSHKYDRYSAKFHLQSANTSNNSFIYGVNVGYSQIRDKAAFVSVFDPSTINNSSVDEKELNVSAVIGAGFKGSNTILAGIAYEASNSLNTDSLDRSNIILHPRFYHKGKRLSFELGLKYNLWWDRGETGNNLFVSCNASFAVIKDKLWLYAFVDGDNNFRNYSSMIDINPWIHPGINIKNTINPLTSRGGLRGTITDRLSFNIYGGYYQYRDQLHFFPVSPFFAGLNMPVNSFDAIYANQDKTGFGAEIAWISESIEASASFDFFKFKDDDGNTDTHYNHSPLEIKLMAGYKIRDRIFIKASAHYSHKSPVLIVNDGISSFFYSHLYIPSSTIVNLDFNYVYNKNLSFFARFYNILNSQAIFLANYHLPGVNAGAGIALKF